MPGYQEIIGHEQIKEHLQNAVTSGKISHAYIFSGPEDSGKRMLADAFAMALQCERGGAQPCLECRSCRQAIDGNHPDIIHVIHEKPNTITVDDIRDQLVNDIVIKPYGRYKIYIIDEAEKMNAQAQNAMLKTIEEPPAYGIILLLTSKPEMLLPTVRSRCITLPLRPVRDSDIRDFLMREYHVPDYQADVCTAFAQGNVGKAIQLATTNDFGELKNEVIALMKRIDDADLYELDGMAKDMAKYKLQITDFFDLMMSWYRDVLYMKTTNDVNGLTFKDEVYSIKKQASRHSYQGLEQILEALDKAGVRYRANVNLELILELLMLSIKEN